MTLVMERRTRPDALSGMRSGHFLLILCGLALLGMTASIWFAAFA
jgi:hypothetical protein